MKRIVVFSGAGMSAESGLKTFRDSGGLWEEQSVYEVATPEAWKENPELVLNFYNMRKHQIMQAAPNDAHLAIASLEAQYEVIVITQNIDDLHERAGSSNVLHLHGEIMKVRGEKFPELIYDTPSSDLKLGDHCPNGSQLRPHVVWFGEPVVEMDRASQIMRSADIALTIGTSLNVYPAASLVHHAPDQARKILIDPGEFSPDKTLGIEFIQVPASKGVPQIVQELLSRPVQV